MKIQERNYSTKVIKPKPVVFQSPDQNMIVVMTCWGESGFKDRIFDEIQKFIFAAQGDIEVTSPFEMNTYLSRDCNFLRMGTLLINDLVFRGENKDSYQSCYELIIIYKNENRISWSQVGTPNLFLLNERLIPLSVSLPLNHSATEQALPLPQQYLGTEMHCHFQLGEIAVNSSHRLFLFNETSLNKDIWALSSTEFTMDQAIKSQIQFDPESPFWMAIIDFKD